MIPSRVVGLGSYQGDDQAAWLLLERLRQYPGLEVEAVTLAEPARLLAHLGGCRQLILVDACQSGQPPGTVTRVTYPGAPLAAQHGRSSHGFDGGAVLGLANALGLLPPRVVIFGIEMQGCEPGAGLSPAVARALPGLCDQVVREIRREADEGRD